MRWRPCCEQHLVRTRLAGARRAWRTTSCVETDDGGAITHVGTAPRPDPASGVLTLDGAAFPAAANAHSHAFHRALRGRTHAGRGDFWTWREQMYAAAGALTPAKYERLATAVFAEMVAAGCSSVAEFHYVHHRPDGAAYGGGPGADGSRSSGDRRRPRRPEHAMELALCPGRRRRRDPPDPAGHLLSGAAASASRWPPNTQSASATATCTPGWKAWTRSARLVADAGPSGRPGSRVWAPPPLGARVGPRIRAAGHCRPAEVLGRSRRCTSTCPSSRPRTRPA